MKAIAKRFGVAFVVLDLLVGVASAGVLHRGLSGGGTGKASAAQLMSSGQLEQMIESSTGAVSASCSTDPSGGWDYYCISSDGSRSLYDVSADRVTQRSDLQPYR